LPVAWREQTIVKLLEFAPLSERSVHQSLRCMMDIGSISRPPPAANAVTKD